MRSYVAGGYYARHEGRHWIRAMLLTASLFPGVCFGIAFSLNTIAIFYGCVGAGGGGDKAESIRPKAR
jgi:transmembrane 9 superfamily protein 3